MPDCQQKPGFHTVWTILDLQRQVHALQQELADGPEISHLRRQVSELEHKLANGEGSKKLQDANKRLKKPTKNCAKRSKI